MLRKNAILFSVLDIEDSWVSCGLAFKTNKTKKYADAYEELKSQLEAPELIEYIIEDRCLENDLFDGDLTYKFRGTNWSNGKLRYTFMNDQGNDVEYSFMADYIYLA